MSKQPLKRIYFDTNILFRWPNLPNNVASLFGVANWVGARLYIPKTVEDELEGQFVRGANATWDAMASDLKELTKLCNQVIAVDVQGRRPDDDDLRAAFRTRSKQLKDYWRIENIPVDEVDLATLLAMAINRDAPFEEIEINKSRRVVTGLQDTAILFAIASHMKTADRDERCALISNDGVFQKKGCGDSLEMADVKLEMFRSVDVLFRDLFDHVWAAVRAGWDEEMKQVEASLNQQKQAIQAQIVPLLNVSKIGGSMWKTTIELKEFEIVEFRDVKTELPPTDYTPPNTAVYKRPDDSRVQISLRRKRRNVPELHEICMTIFARGLRWYQWSWNRRATTDLLRPRSYICRKSGSIVPRLRVMFNLCRTNCTPRNSNIWAWWPQFEDSAGSLPRNTK